MMPHAPSRTAIPVVIGHQPVQARSSPALDPALETENYE
jgi:hypothetical protein